MVAFDSVPYIQIVISLLVPVAILVTHWVVKKLVLNLARAKQVPSERGYQVYRYFKVLITLGWLVVLLAVWGIDYQALLVVVTSILAVLGVALVAQWSILSNITASIIVFFTLPAKIGDRIEILDGANSLTGRVQEINFFNVLLVDDQGNQVAYPNNLIVQKAVRKLVLPRPSGGPEAGAKRRLQERRLRRK